MSSLLAGRRSAKPAPLRFTLPDLPALPEEHRGRAYTLGETGWLLGSGDSNTKLLKSELSGEYLTWGLSLSPAKTSGYQLCASSSAGCRAVCLNYQGRARVFSGIGVGRIARAVAWMEHRSWFEARLRWELSRVVRKADREGKAAAVRLNVMSDVFWERETPWVFVEFPAVQFYDYTKHYKRMLRWVQGELPPNYHLTFSRSETNHDEALDIVRRGGTATVVFRDKRLPARWCGHDVQDGDQTDLRFLDRPGCWVGLYAKGTAKHDRTGFVADARRLPLN
jgi:hypothetical protein